MNLKYINNLLAFILTLLGVAITFIPSEKYETIINIMGIAIIIIGITIFIISIYSTQRAEKKSKKIYSKIEGLDYEAQRQRLLEKAIPVRYVNGLGENPLFKHHYQSGEEYEKKGNYREAIKNYKEILIYRLIDEENIVATYNLIGLCYFKLFEFEEAMKNFEMALNIVKVVEVKEDQLKSKAAILNNIGLIYQNLEQWKNALKKFKSTLRLYSKLDDKLGKADSLYNIQLISFQLNKPKKSLGKIKKAIQAYQDCLKVYTLEKFSMNYSIIQENLGNTYRYLTVVKGTAENYEKAIQAYQESLRARALEDYPREYATIQYNLGFTYYFLSKVKDKAKNCEKAIYSYLEALAVFTPKGFPKKYIEISHFLSIAYQTFGEIKDKDKDEYYDKAMQILLEVEMFNRERVRQFLEKLNKEKNENKRKELFLRYFH